MRSRCASATPVSTGLLGGWSLSYDKPSTDGSAKANIRRDMDGFVPGVLYEVEDGERQALDEAEPLYTPIDVEIDGCRAVAYAYDGDPHDREPFDWYVSTCLLGSASHGLPGDHLDVESMPDPLAPGIRPATRDDFELIQAILSGGLSHPTDRYYVHPGDYAWWVYHDDPRHPDHFSTWIQDGSGFVVIDSLDPPEINVFTRPGVDRMPLVRWAQRRVNDRAEVGWVDDRDDQFVEELKADGYEVVSVDRSYRWDLAGPVPDPVLPRGWTLRPVLAEDEANSRRAASHAAFESTMPDAVHLQRYLDFMRSPVYVPERDLVAVNPEGRVASFMVWWADDSGIAQIEPFGTHPDFFRQGVGRALIHYGLRRMKMAGMKVCRVLTNDWRAATSFYEGVGFEDVGAIRWWAKK